MFPILRLGPFAIQTAGLILILGVWVGLWLAEREAARLKFHNEFVYNLAFTGLVAGLIGARLWYVLQHLQVYVLDPLAIFSPTPATLARTEGVAIGLMAAALYGVRHKLPLRLTLDALAPAMVVTMIASALANLASGDAFGAPAQLPWSLYLWGEYRHPSQVYEMIAALGVLRGWAWWRRQERWRPAPGISFLWVAASLAAARVFLEAFRSDSVIVGEGWRAAQVGSLFLLTTSLALSKFWSRSPTSSDI